MWYTLQWRALIEGCYCTVVSQLSFSYRHRCDYCGGWRCYNILPRSIIDKKRYLSMRDGDFAQIAKSFGSTSIIYIIDVNMSKSHLRWTFCTSGVEYIDGSGRDCSISSVFAMDIRQPCMKPSFRFFARKLNLVWFWPIFIYAVESQNYTHNACIWRSSFVYDHDAIGSSTSLKSRLNSPNAR